MSATSDFLQAINLRMKDKYSLLPPSQSTPFSFFDNSPWHSAGTFGKSGTPSYYFMDEPTENALYTTARYTPLGYRITYGLSEDIFINEYAYTFPQNEFDNKTVKEINGKIREHKKKIGAYPQQRLSCGFDLEQGESLLMVYRKSDKAGYYTESKAFVPNYSAFSDSPDKNEEITRVEAINRLDYTIPDIGAFGKPGKYLINYFSEKNMEMSYPIHPERVVRVKMNNINYDQYKGQGLLKACFGHLQIINNLDRAAGQGAYRWALGMPIFFTKGIRQKDIPTAKTLIGDPTTQKYMLLPLENFEKVEMKGLAESSMDLPGMENMIIDQIAALTQIPKTILMGQAAGMVAAGEVNERSYFACLDKWHSKYNPYIYELDLIDPFMQQLFAEYKITNYEIDWGLRQVMSEEQKAQLIMSRATNAISMMNFATFNEVRNYMELPPLSAVMKDEDVKYFYGPEMTVERVGSIIPNFGQWRQRTASEILETPQEREEAEIQKEAAEVAKNESGNVQKMKNTDPKRQNEFSKELERKEKRFAREEGQKMGDMVQTQFIKEVAEQLLDVRQQQNKVGMDKLAELLGIAAPTAYKVLDVDKLKLIIKQCKEAEKK